LETVSLSKMIFFSEYGGSTYYLVAHAVELVHGAFFGVSAVVLVLGAFFGVFAVGLVHGA